MNKLLIFVLVLAAAGLAPVLALAQCYKTSYYSGGSYVAPAPPPRTYTTYSTYTVPSYNYNSYKSSYTAPSYNSYTPRSSYSSYSGSDSPRPSPRTYSSPARPEPPAAPVRTNADHWEYMQAYFYSNPGIISSAALVDVGQLAAADRTKYYQMLVGAIL